MRWLQPLIVGFLGFVAYLPQCGYPFVYDDVFIVERNETVRGGPWLDCLAKPYWPREFGTDPLYRPVTMLSLRLNHAAFGDRPLSYRVANAVLHGVCATLVALLAVRLWSLGGGPVPRRIGWIAGLLFAVHPIHADAVASVVGRTELLAAMFSLAVLYRHAGLISGRSAPSVGHHLVTAVLLLLAVGSKEHAVLTLPAVVLLDMWARRRDGPRIRLRESVNRLARSHYLGMVLALTVFLFARWLMFGGRTILPADQVDPFANPLIGASAVTLAATPLALWSLALGLFGISVSLCPLWSIGGFDLPQTLWRADVLVGGSLVMAAAVVIFAGLRRRWTVSLLMALTGLFLLLPCHFVPAANWLFAERWLYLPSAFLAILIAGAVRWRPAFALLSVSAIGLFAVNWQYQQNWRSNLDLAQSVLIRHPHSYHALVFYLHERRSGGQLLAAEPYVDRLLDRFPTAPRTWFYCTLLMDQHDRPRETLDAYNTYIRLSGPNPIPAGLRDARNRARAALESEARLP